MANRLAGETSPYLLQHKDNPVDWYAWNEEAFAKAKTEGKPIFLSIGYSSCHWCHVMEHESFESDDVARILNDSFVSIKVDREERPDVDEAYMTAVQLSTGRGGWPMTVFLTPDKKPFFAGTYFPREDRGEHPGFLRICTQIAALWKEKRAEIEDNANEFAVGLAESIGQAAPMTLAKFDDEFLANAVKTLAADFDNKHGGFGSAPKFPPHTSIDLLLRFVHRDSAQEELRQVAIGMALSTLEQMALGGLHDHVGGGFHRYSTDERWLLPHFEKMLYDNALMLGNYALAAAMVHDVDPKLEELFVQAANGIAIWAITEMATPDGLFCSAFDADSEGEEGRFYVWTVSEIRAILGDRAPAFIEAFGIEEAGNFQDEATREKTGANIPHLKQPRGRTFDEELEALRAVREKRIRPARDDKALVSWNGLIIAGLAQAGLLDRAEVAAAQILGAEERHGALPHQIVGGIPSGQAYLDDYASFAWSLIQLSRIREQFPAKETPDWLAEGERLTKRMIELFGDEAGGFFSTSEAHEELFGRSKPAFDSPTPSANGMALRCLVALGDQERAGKTLNAFLGWMERDPQATEALYAAALPLAGESPVAALQPAAAPLEVTVRLEPREIMAAGGTGSGAVILSIPEGLHLNSHTPPARWLTPTALAFQPLKAEIDYPEGIDETYEGEVRIPFTLYLPSGSGGEEFEIKVSYQACTDTECLLPSEKVLNGVLIAH